MTIRWKLGPNIHAAGKQMRQPTFALNERGGNGIGLYLDSLKEGTCEAVDVLAKGQTVTRAKSPLSTIRCQKEWVTPAAWSSWFGICVNVRKTCTNKPEKAINQLTSRTKTKEGRAKGVGGEDDEDDGERRRGEGTGQRVGEWRKVTSANVATIPKKEIEASTRHNACKKYKRKGGGRKEDKNRQAKDKKITYLGRARAESGGPCLWTNYSGRGRECSFVSLMQMYTIAQLRRRIVRVHDLKGRGNWGAEDGARERIRTYLLCAMENDWGPRCTSLAASAGGDGIPRGEGAYIQPLRTQEWVGMRGVRMGERGLAVFVWGAALLESSARRREVLGVGCLAVAEELGDEPVVGVGVRGKSSLPPPAPRLSTSRASHSGTEDKVSSCKVEIMVQGYAHATHDVLRRQTERVSFRHRGTGEKDVYVVKAVRALGKVTMLSVWRVWGDGSTRIEVSEFQWWWYESEYHHGRKKTRNSPLLSPLLDFSLHAPTTAKRLRVPMSHRLAQQPISDSDSEGPPLTRGEKRKATRQANQERERVANEALAAETNGRVRKSKAEVYKNQDSRSDSVALLSVWAGDKTSVRNHVQKTAQPGALRSSETSSSKKLKKTQERPQPATALVFPEHEDKDSQSGQRQEPKSKKAASKPPVARTRRHAPPRIPDDSDSDEESLAPKPVVFKAPKTAAGV
ncbi:hypothetical protein B0H14DRAFT_2632136 [Mycena olivaceomarginata]|nr:hypothetical protein B0H14DRAFT_2632136 [Mycena olivaceomarginata]